MITYGSVCSGIESASVAWEPLGMKAEWFSEIEPYPCAVLAHHWPHVANVGDMTHLPLMVRCGIASAPDVLVGGTPCQAFSVAGKRESLADSRGGLSLIYGDLLNAIDGRRGEGNEAVCVWENVPGVLSTSDNAFGFLLGLLAGEYSLADCLSGAAEPLKAQPGADRQKWTKSGCVIGPRRTVAWRVLDAQFFGLAQRRKRVFVVASAREGFDPAKVLFEFEGVRRDTPPSRETGKETPGGVGVGSHWDSPAEPHPTLNQSHNTGGVGMSNQEIFGQRGAYLAPVWPPDTACTLDATFGDKYGQGNQHVDAGCPLFVPADGGAVGTLTAGGINTLDTGAATAGHMLAVPTHDKATRHTGRVRKLTPVECERLQGFPDNHTRVPYRGKPAEDAPDGPRYKAIGNSKAVSAIRWLGVRLIIEWYR